MNENDRGEDARLIADLNDLLQLDHDAVQAYTIAIDMARDETIRDTLVRFRQDHKRHIEELAALVRDRGALPTELPHPTSPLKAAVQALGAAVNDDALLLAFEAVEGQARDKYQRFAQHAYPAGVGEVVRRAADDEKAHFGWVERTLRDRGLGSGTLPHSLAQLVEGVHKVLADPAESLGRQVMRGVGAVVGTRGGRAAPGRGAGPRHGGRTRRRIGPAPPPGPARGRRLVPLIAAPATVAADSPACPHRGRPLSVRLPRAAGAARVG